MTIALCSFSSLTDEQLLEIHDVEVSRLAALGAPPVPNAKAGEGQSQGGVLVTVAALIPLWREFFGVDGIFWVPPIRR